MPDARSWRQWLLVSSAMAWCLAIVFAPVAADLQSGYAGHIYASFSAVCHQIPDRSFHLMGHPFPVCARCTGLYFGFLAGLLILPRWVLPARYLMFRPRLMLLFWVPMAIDLLLDNTGSSRFLTGALAAFPVALFVSVAAEEFSLSTVRSCV